MSHSCSHPGKILAAYDISDKAALSKARGLLMDLGFVRLQKSVYASDAMPDEISKGNLERIIKDTGELRFYSLCSRCACPFEVIGKSQEGFASAFEKGRKTYQI